MHDKDDCKIELVQWILRSKPNSKSAEKDNHTHKKMTLHVHKEPSTGSKIYQPRILKKNVFEILRTKQCTGYISAATLV